MREPQLYNTANRKKVKWPRMIPNYEIFKSTKNSGFCSHALIFNIFFRTWDLRAPSSLECFSWYFSWLTTKFCKTINSWTLCFPIEIRLIFAKLNDGFTNFKHEINLAMNLKHGLSNLTYFVIYFETSPASLISSVFFDVSLLQKYWC